MPFPSFYTHTLDRLLDDVEMGSKWNEPEICGNEMLCLEEVVTGSGKQPVCEETGRFLFLENLFLIPSIVVMHYNDPAVSTDLASTQDHHKQDTQRMKVGEADFSADY